MTCSHHGNQDQDSRENILCQDSGGDRQANPGAEAVKIVIVERYNY